MSIKLCQFCALLAHRYPRPDVIIERGRVRSCEVGVAGLRQGSDKVHCFFSVLQHHEIHKLSKMQLLLQKVVVVILLSCVGESPLRVQGQSMFFLLHNVIR